MKEEEKIGEDICYQDLYINLAKLLNYFSIDSKYKYLKAILIRKKLDIVSVECLNHFVSAKDISPTIKNYIIEITLKTKKLIDNQNSLLLENISIINRINKVKQIASERGIDASGLHFIPTNKFNTLNEMNTYKKNIFEISNQLERFETALSIKKEIEEENQAKEEKQIVTSTAIINNNNNKIEETIPSEIEITKNNKKRFSIAAKANINGVLLIILIFLIIIAIALTIYMIFIK